MNSTKRKNMKFSDENTVMINDSTGAMRKIRFCNGFDNYRTAEEYTDNDSIVNMYLICRDKNEIIIKPAMEENDINFLDNLRDEATKYIIAEGI